MSDMVSVPAEKIAALRETISWMDNPGPEDWGERLTPEDVVRAARAVVDAVETEDEHKDWCKKPWKGYCTCNTPAPSPARDDAEEAIAGLLAEHAGAMSVKDVQDLRAACHGCDWVGPWRQSTLPANNDHRAHVASVIAAHMAAPDELTALPTVPGSVIEAATTGSASLWMRGAQNTWFKEDGEHAADADLRLLRVLFDAGKGWTTP